MLLLRLRDLNPVHRRFAEELAATCGDRVACVVDERAAPVDTAPWPKVSLTIPRCKQLGLHCPDDFAWRCGDYGLYLARQQFPDEPYFWLIEPDVRFAGGGGPAAFFAMFRSATADFLAGHLRPADHTHYWEFMIIARNLAPWRCLFPVVRVSARALDFLLDRRIAFARNRRRLSHWPNDESFVATLLANHPAMTCRDLNDFGAELYDERSLSYWAVHDGDTFVPRQDRLTLYHSVLFGAEYAAKLRRVEASRPDRRLHSRVRRRLLRELNKRTAWT